MDDELVASPEPQSSIMFCVRVSASCAIYRTAVYVQIQRVAQSGRGLNGSKMCTA